MRYHELLREMPQLIDATDFNLMDAEVNAQLAQKLLSAPNREIIEDTDDFVLFRTGHQNGNIALITKMGSHVDYWVRFQTMHKRIVGKTVTQVAVWRDNESPFVEGITKRIFFEYLLDRWPTIMSDAIQTPQGQEFWVRRMVNAALEGRRVGLVDMNAQKVIWFDPEQMDIRNWLRDHRSAWSSSKNDQGKRFLISRA